MASPRSRILAVDDRPANLVALEAVLADKYELVLAHSGPEAITVLERDSNVDVILMDVQMPGMDGFEAAQRIKAIPGCDDIPIVFLTAVHHEDPHVRRGYAAGGVDYFSKPFEPSLLRLKLDVYASFRHRASLLRVREEQVRESEGIVRAARNLSSVAEGLPAGVIVFDLSGRACQMSEEALRILEPVSGIERGAYRKALDWLQGNGAVLRGRPASPTETAESLHGTVVRVQCLDGTSKSLFESTMPLRGADGEIVGQVVVLQDMTAPIRFEADLEARIAHLVSLGEKLGDASHRQAQTLPG